MNEAHDVKRDRIRKLLIAATGLGLSAAMQHAAAQTTRPTAGPPVAPPAQPTTAPPAQPTTAPPTVVSTPVTPAPRPPASKAR